MSYKIFTCIVCGYVYNEELGDEEHGLVPGTRWQDVPDDWECPDCGAVNQILRWLRVNGLSRVFV